jgi:hypothetical protein
MTKFYVGGLSTRMIAEIMVWEENAEERIITRMSAKILPQRR